MNLSQVLFDVVHSRNVALQKPQRKNWQFTLFVAMTFEKKQYRCNRGR